MFVTLSRTIDSEFHALACVGHLGRNSYVRLVRLVSEPTFRMVIHNLNQEIFYMHDAKTQLTGYKFMNEIPFRHIRLV